MIASQLVSVVMCVYNGERFLNEQIESILNQTYSFFEFLILDDQSTDSSFNIIVNYAKKDSRIRYSRNDENIGFNRNFEKGLQLSTGDLIAISDQDDVWLNTKLECLVNNIHDNLLIYSNSVCIDEFGTMLDIKLNHNIIHVDKPTYKSFLNDNFITGHTCLFKKALLNVALPFPVNIFFYDWWLGFCASYVGNVGYIERVLTHYRIHSESVMQTFTESKIQRFKKVAQLNEFAASFFIKEDDRKFINELMSKKMSAKNDPFSFFACYRFLYKHHEQIYPWYKKSIIKKINFLRKQCLK